MTSGGVASRPRLLDAFCGAGGASVGYHRAGFDVFGVDIAAQARYPYGFKQADALTFIEKHGHRFDAIHASPPCQAYSRLSALYPHNEYRDYLPELRPLLESIGVPYIIENVPQAPLIRVQSIVLCGGMFGLRTYRHRQFESHRCDLVEPIHPRHLVRSTTSKCHERWQRGWNITVTGHVGRWFAVGAMGIGWMSSRELSQAIPPAYTEYVGKQLVRFV